MKTSTLLRVATPLVGLGLLVSACGSSNTSTASGGNASSTTAAGGASTTAGGSGSGSGSGSGGTLCTVVAAPQMAELLGEKVTAAEDLTASSRFRSTSNLPGCKYLGEPVAGSEFMLVSAEKLPCSEADAFFDDPVAQRKDLAGVGDKAMYRPDAGGTGTVIDTFSKKGDECLYVRIFKGAPEATAKQVTNALWGA